MSLLVPSRYSIQKPAVGARLNTAHPLAQGLKHFFILNEGAGRIVHDLCYNLGFTTYDAAPPTWSPGGLTWNGSWVNATTVQQIQVPALTGTTITTPQTLECWIKLPAGTTGNIMLLEQSNGNTNSAAQGIGIGVGNTTMDNSGTTLIALNEGVAWHSSGVAIPTNINRFTQIALVYQPNPGTSVFFIGGRRVATASYAALAAGTGAALNFYLGGYFPAGKGTGRVWGAGTLGMARHYTRALTDAEIAHLSVEPYAMMQPYNGFLRRVNDGGVTPSAWHTSVVKVWK